MHEITLPDGRICHYSLNRSWRAKYVRIKLSPEKGLRVVLPADAPDSVAHDFVAERKHWIHKHLLKFEQMPVQELKIPEVLNLRLLREKWPVKAHHAPENRMLLQPEPGQSVRLEGNCDNLELVCAVLEKWLKRKARHAFPPLLDALAEAYGFDYNRLTVRAQKTRWGSCSARGNINLNYKLLFFPPEVGRYVMLHELCHTLEMNHSAQFWAHVRRCDPHYQKHRAVLKQAGDFIPPGL